jgi:FdhD protein
MLAAQDEKQEAKMTEIPKTIATYQVHRVFASGEAPELIACTVLAEQALTIRVKQVGEFTLLCTAIDLEALAVGFAHSEGMIDSVADVVSISSDEKEPDVIELQIAAPSRAGGGRNMLVSSSCGMCGARLIDKTLWNTRPVPNSLLVTPKFLFDLPERLSGKQVFRRLTHGAHAAGIFDAKGDFIAFAEDIGRHNALDKAIGKCLLERRSLAGCGVALTSRASFEMVAKAGRAGLELIAAVSAPSSLAVEVADTLNVTLCASVHRTKADVYTHPERVLTAPARDASP